VTARKLIGSAVVVMSVLMAGSLDAQPAQSIFGPIANTRHGGKPAKPMSASLRQYLQTYLGKDMDEDMKPTTLVRWAQLPLTRGKSEIVVYISGGGPKDLGEMGGWCGSSGCEILIIEPSGKSYRPIGEVQGWPPIRRLPTSTNGRPDLAIWVQGGGVYPGYATRIRFNGAQYPVLPGAPNGPKLKKRAGSKMLIGGTEPGEFLYP